MQATRVETGFGFENLVTREVEIPTPGPGEVLVEVSAASLNYRDLLVLTGRYNPRFPLPLTLGSDAVGTIVKVGEGVGKDAEIGSRVCPLFAQGWFDGPPRRHTTRQSLGGPLPGVFAEYVLARADSVVKPPDYLSDVEAACLPCAALTAWSALATLSQLRKNETLLTIGSGGVSVFGIQIARALGARVFSTTRSPGKQSRLEALGASAVVDATREGWGDIVRKLAGGEGVDHVLEVGGAETLADSIRAVRPGGVISLIGLMGGSEGTPSLLPVVMRNLRLQGVFVGHRASFEAMLQTFTAHAIRPVVDTVYPFGRVHEALRHLESGKHFGKICLSQDA